MSDLFTVAGESLQKLENKQLIINPRFLSDKLVGILDSFAIEIEPSGTSSIFKWLTVNVLIQKKGDWHAPCYAFC